MIKCNKYVIDTNILINFRIFTPPEHHETFWKKLSESISLGAIILIEDVADECTHEPLKSWAQKQKKTKIDSVVLARSIKINNKYKLITEEASGQTKSEADPVIIAYAEKNK